MIEADERDDDGGGTIALEQAQRSSAPVFVPSLLGCLGTIVFVLAMTLGL